MLGGTSHILQQTARARQKAALVKTIYEISTRKKPFEIHSEGEKKTLLWLHGTDLQTKMLFIEGKNMSFRLGPKYEPHQPTPSIPSNNKQAL